MDEREWLIKDVADAIENWWEWSELVDGPEFIADWLLDRSFRKNKLISWQCPECSTVVTSMIRSAPNDCDCIYRHPRHEIDPDAAESLDDRP